MRTLCVIKVRMAGWECEECRVFNCSSRMYCAGCGFRAPLSFREFTDTYGVILWLHPRHSVYEIHEIKGKLGADMEWVWPMEGPSWTEGIYWWRVKMSKWGEIIEGAGEMSISDIDELYTYEMVDEFYHQLQIYRDNILEEP